MTATAKTAAAIDTAMIALPRALQVLVDDATEQGMTVKIDRTAGVSVWVESAVGNASVTYTVQGVHAVGTLKGSRTGFYVSAPEKYVLKFSYGTGKDYRGYTSLRSVRQARACVGLTV